MTDTEKEMIEEYNRLVDRFSELSIMVVGDLMVDEYMWGEVSRVSQEAPVPIVAIGKRSFRLGGACNVATNIAAVGARALLVGVVGDDYRAGVLRGMLNERGISTDGLIHDADRATTTKTRVIARGQQIVRCDEESTEELSKGPREQVIEFVEKHIDEVDGIAIEDYGKGVICPDVTREVLKIARSRGKIITVDPKDENFLLYKDVTVMTPNQHEVATFLGKRIETLDELITATRKLRDETRSKAILATRGEHGMLLLMGEGAPINIDTVAKDVYDVTGAGDTVIALMTLALSAGASMERSARLSNMAAGIVVTEIGAATVSVDELKASIRDNLSG
ncbi:D-glycero-beta-D-manno-heptose-7-phosphate kinase [bacterium]|nr:D-glycero-beta-D-manno-heptose-7-phosphate kinase [bacterium]